MVVEESHEDWLPLSNAIMAHHAQTVSPGGISLSRLWVVPTFAVVAAAAAAAVGRFPLLGSSPKGVCVNGLAAAERQQQQQIAVASSYANEGRRKFIIEIISQSFFFPPLLTG